MQLVAYGAQDIYLTGNPQITFFKVVYRRHTNFSMESIKQTFLGTPDFGGSVTATISRNGDLLYRMYLEHDVAFKSSTHNRELGVCCDYGSHLMKTCELEIGGQLIDKHYGHWHSVYSQLTHPNSVGDGLTMPSAGEPRDVNTLGTTLFNRLSGNGQGLQTTAETGGGTAVFSEGGWTADSGASGIESHMSGRFWIPLYFWFCRNPGLALPLIALQYHEVKVKITFDDLGQLVVRDGAARFREATGTALPDTADTVTTKTFDLWCDYIYLDTDERRRFAQVSHEYLIEQVQFISKSGGGSMKLNFNHPVKELIWAGARESTVSQDVGTYFGGTPGFVITPYSNLFKRNALGDGTYCLTLNGHNRFKRRNYKYFTRTQVWEHHTGYGGTTPQDSIAVYSFALKPEEHQPSGTCNFSRIDTAFLVEADATTTADINIYAVNYNVLRIMSGMGGLAYSN